MLGLTRVSTTMPKLTTISLIPFDRGLLSAVRVSDLVINPRVFLFMSVACIVLNVIWGICGAVSVAATNVLAGGVRRAVAAVVLVL